jgi:hypothetical protein
MQEATAITEGMQSLRKDVFLSKIYVISVLYPGESILMMDYDMMFTSKVNFSNNDHVGLQSFMNPVWNNRFHFSCYDMISMGANEFTKRTKTVLSRQELEKRLQQELGWGNVDKLWINGGLIYFHSDFRNNIKTHLEVLKTDVMQDFLSGDEERFYMHLSMTNSSLYKNDESTKLNFPAGTFELDVEDTRNMQSITGLVHFQTNRKPCDIVIGRDGIMNVGAQRPMWDNDYYTRLREVNVNGSYSLYQLTMLWHYYYSMVYYSLSKDVGIENVHPTQRFESAFDLHTRSRHEWMEMIPDRLINFT